MKCIVAFLTIALLFSTAYATVWYVHPDSTMNCIQYGLDSCSTGDTVLVGPGTYHENIVWPATDGIDLISENGPVFTIIDGDSAGRVITISANVDTTTNIDGFTIRNGYLVGEGAGICCAAASPRIVGNVLTANAANGYPYGGGGISCANYSSAIIANNTITGNYGASGGGIRVSANSHATIVGNLIHDNVADTTGGGIDCYVNSSPYIAGNILANNSAKWGGGISIMYNSSPHIDNNTISGNTATSMGGGVYCYNDCSPFITNSMISDNTCEFYGAGIRFSTNTSGVLRHCVISSNNGRGIEMRQSTPDIDSCTIEYNTINGVYILDGGEPTINWCNIVGNTPYGVVNTNAPVTIDAENNWWGHASGPGGVGPGSGDPVSTYVDYDPWLTNPGVGGYDISVPFILNVKVSPNPFHLTTEIRYMIQDSGYMIEESALDIYDAAGRLVRSFDLESCIVNHESSISWDGTDQSDRPLPAGVYFVTLRAGERAENEKVLLVR